MTADAGSTFGWLDHMRRCAGNLAIVWSMAMTPAVVAGAGSGGDGTLASSFLEELRVLVRAGDWPGAHALVRRDEAARAILDGDHCFGHSIDDCWQLAAGVKDNGAPGTVFIYRAYAVAALGLHDLGLEIIETAGADPAVRPSTIDRVYVEVANRAALEALAAGDLEQGLEYLRRPPRKNPYAVNDELLDHLRVCIQAPLDPFARLAAAQDLYWLAERGATPSYGWMVEWLTGDPRLHYAGTARRDLHVFLHSCAVRRLSRGWTGLRAPAETHLRALRAEFPEDPVTDGAVLLAASAEPERKAAILHEELVRSGRVNEATARAHLFLARFRRRGGDVEAARRLLAALSDFPRLRDPPREAMLAGLRRTALQQLARLYRDEGDFVTALKLYESLGPAEHWCGNCRWSITAERSLFMAECLVELSRLDEVIETLVIPVLAGRAPAEGHEDRFARLAVRIYEERGRLGELLLLLDEAPRSSLAARRTRHVMALHRAAARGDVEHLVASIVPAGGVRSSFDHQARIASFGLDRFPTPNPVVGLLARMAARTRSGVTRTLIDGVHGTLDGETAPDKTLWLLLSLSLIEDERVTALFAGLEDAAADYARRPRAPVNESHLASVRRLSETYEKLNVREHP